jgi:hypothetical protein
MPGPIFLRRVGLGLACLLMATAQAGPEYDLDRKQLESVVEDLKAWLPGSWDSFPQVYYERTVASPEEGEHEHWHRIFALIDAPQVGEVVFYGQLNVGGRDGAIMGGSQVLYKTWIDEARGVVVINGQGPKDPDRFENLHERPELWHQVQMRDEAGIRCDFIWRRDGEQIVGVLEGKTEERRKYGPGTCSYISPRTDAEFYADAEWVLTPNELWLYDVNTMGGYRFLGREDRTHIRLYKAQPYACTVGSGAAARTWNGHDRGFAADLDAGGQTLRMLLLRGEYPAADGYGLDDELRLMLHPPGDLTPLAQTRAAPGAERISLAHGGTRIECTRQVKFPPMAQAD